MLPMFRLHTLGLNYVGSMCFSDYAFVLVASNVLQFKCMACTAKITTYSLKGSEKLLQLVSNYSMVSNLKDNEFEVWNQGFFMSPIGAGTIYFLMYLVGLQFMAI
ncbi:hypothetical protein V6Z11_D08G119300 [Gossypium hirsutum]|uniref:Uncharacterized protein n=1 Tax=Gossypium hirsutum TaxID=3635 RepID=A0ABM3AGY7_GOSHI|nr:uncharacterized protein LOC121219802 [Gossypium hirsutum]